METSMNRIAFLVLVAWAAIAPAAWAQDKPDGDDSRFTFTRIEDGYLRLDSRTGQVSVCTRRTAGWTCLTVADERAALEAEIARLQGENAALKKELLARNLPLPGVVKPDPPPAKTEEPKALPDDADLTKMMAFVEKVWRRMVEIITNLQREAKKKS
jgi:hypothetical protein